MRAASIAYVRMSATCSTLKVNGGRRCRLPKDPTDERATASEHEGSPEAAWLAGEETMSLRIDQDHRRFREIVRGKIKQNLRKYITQGEMLGKKGKEIVSIPLPQIDIPHFRFGAKQQGGVGQGEGEPGDPLGGEPQPGTGKAGDRPGDHILEVDVTMEELAQILGEELRLPRIEP